MNEPFIPEKLQAGAISELRRQLSESQSEHAKAITRIAQLIHENEKLTQQLRSRSMRERLKQFFERY